MFSYCYSLTSVIAPANMKYSIELPKESGRTWYDEDGTVCTEMAAGLLTSMVYMRTPAVSAITVAKYDEDEGVYTESL